MAIARFRTSSRHTTTTTKAAICFTRRSATPRKTSANVGRNGHGGWIWNLQSTRVVLYRLRELLAADPSLPVYVAEGEKDADRLVAEGLVATTSPMGAGKWRPEYAESLRDRVVVVLSDNDTAGREHAASVASPLEGIARRVCVIHLPGLPEKGDPSDWFNQGHTVEDLEDLVEQAPEPERPLRRFKFLTAAEAKGSNRTPSGWSRMRSSATRSR